MARARDDRTLDFFEIPQAPAPTGGSLDYETELCCTLSEMIAEAMRRGIIRSRFDLAARMSELTGKEITKAMIDSWTAESKELHRFPFAFSAAMESACDSTRLRELLGRKMGSRILVAEDSMLAKLGLIHKKRAELAEEERAIKSQLKGSRR